MTTERRQSSPEYRERVNQAALVEVRFWEHDHDCAVESVERMIAAGYKVAFHRDVLSLLRRRAETVKGMRVP